MDRPGLRDARLISGTITLVAYLDGGFKVERRGVFETQAGSDEVFNRLTEEAEQREKGKSAAPKKRAKRRRQVVYDSNVIPFPRVRRPREEDVYE
jgi:hypothetical protein